MFVYSGNCRLCDVGSSTPIFDCKGQRLFTGDIVIIFTENWTPDHLTVIVSDQYQSYSDGTHVVKDGDLSYFAMGIKSVDFTETGEWNVLRVKEQSDVIPGEHWQAYGFSYRNE